MPFNLTTLLCCLNSKSVYCIEMTMMVVELIGLLLKIIGLLIIPWKYATKVMHYLFIICMVFLGVLELFSFYIFLYRSKKHRLNNSKFRKLFYFAFILLFIVILGLLFEILNLFSTSTDLKENNKPDNKNPSGEKNVTDGELFFSIIIFLLCTVVFLILLPLWVSELLRIKYKVSGSLDDIIININQRAEQGSITDKIYCEKRKGFSIVGHDKFGNPILGKQEGNKIITIQKTLDAATAKTEEKRYYNNNNQTISRFVIDKENYNDNKKAYSKKDTPIFKGKKYDNQNNNLMGNINQNTNNEKFGDAFLYNDNDNSINPGY